MAPGRKRVPECVGSVPHSCPRIHEKIAGGDTAHNTWIVLDKHNAHQNRWIDFAYTIEVPDGFKAAHVIVECKTGYENDRAKLNGYCKKFFAEASQFARTQSDIFFVAVSHVSTASVISGIQSIHKIWNLLSRWSMKNLAPQSPVSLGLTTVIPVT